MIDCKFTTNSIKFGLKGQTPLLEGQTDYTIKPNESTWSIDPDSGEATVILVKAVTHGIGNLLLKVLVLLISLLPK